MFEKWFGRKPDGPKMRFEDPTVIIEELSTGSVVRKSVFVDVHIAPDGVENVIVDRWSVEKAEKAYLRRVTKRVFGNEHAMSRVNIQYPMTEGKQPVSTADILALAKAIESDLQASSEKN